MTQLLNFHRQAAHTSCTEYSEDTGKSSPITHFHTTAATVKTLCASVRVALSNADCLLVAECLRSRNLLEISPIPRLTNPMTA